MAMDAYRLPDERTIRRQRQSYLGPGNNFCRLDWRFDLPARKTASENRKIRALKLCLLLFKIAYVLPV